MTEQLATATGIAAVAGVGVPAATIGVLNLAGFTAGGVAAASAAAGVQAGIGSVAAGGLFAGAQSLAAVGLGSAIVSIGLPLAAVSLVGYGAYLLFR